MPFTCAFAKKQVESERKDIDSIENTIVVNGCPLRAVTKVRTWNKDHKVYTHIYYNVRKASGIRVVLISNDVKDAEHATVLKGKLPTAQNKCSVLKFLFLFLDLGVVIHNPWLQIPPLLFFCG